MRNLNTYNVDASEFLDQVVASKRNRKHDPDFKQRVQNLSPTVKILYEQYDSVHSSNTHYRLEPHGFNGEPKDDLLKLYTPNNSKLTALKNSITTIHDDRVLNTCQYCTIQPAGSLDHIVPKEEFPEFAVNPKNLLPSCTTCNGHKFTNWREHDRTLFLNLYTDTLPSEQYLFVSLILEESDILASFELRNENEIEPQLFIKLQSHYDRLHLFHRFKEESPKIISELSNLVKASSSYLKLEEIREITLGKVERDKAIFGNNYYKSILEEELVNNEWCLSLMAQED